MSLLCCDVIHKFLDRGVPVETQTPITVQRPQRSPSTRHPMSAPTFHLKKKTNSTHLVDIVHHPINNLPFERLEHNRPIPCHEFRLATTRQNHTRTNIENGYDSDDITECTRTSPFNVCVEFGFEVLCHARPEVGRVEENRMGKFFLFVMRFCFEFFQHVWVLSLVSGRTMKNIFWVFYVRLSLSVKFFRCRLSQPALSRFVSTVPWEYDIYRRARSKLGPCI